MSTSSLAIRTTALLLSIAAAPVGAVSMDMATVAHPGNAPDPLTLAGSVAHEYRIGTFDITIGEYVEFLNAVARRDPGRLYNPKMATDLQVAGIRRTGRPGRYVYTALAPSGPVQSAAATADRRPITYVSWFDAARFANWMANGQPTGRQNRRTTEDGAYKLKSRLAARGFAVPKNLVNPNTGQAPLYYIPSDNEWYKAAYYSPELQGGLGGYVLYATQSDTAPGNLVGHEPNQVNYVAQGLYAMTQQLSLDTRQNYLTDVGAFSRTKTPYGAFDMNGGVWEWNDMDGSASPNHIIRGGGWTSYDTYLQSSYRLGNAATSQSSNVGFRLAEPPRESRRLF